MAILHRPISRRAILAGLTLSGLGAAAGCGSAPEGGAEQAEGWSFTDDQGTRIDLPRRPERIAGLVDQVAALWNFGLPPVAAFGYLPMDQDVQLAGKDLSGVVQVGGAFGEIDIEALAETTPDLIVATVYSEDPEEVPYGFNDLAQVEQVRAIAPVAVIAQVGSARDVIARNEELAEALGADLDGAEVRGARVEFDEAAQALTAAAAGGLSVLPIAAYPDEGLYCAKYEDDPALTYYQSLGVSFVDLQTEDYYWEVLSWENVSTYPADVFLNSLRAMPTPELYDQPTFARLPAAQARQVFDWNFQSMDYVGQALCMRQLATDLAASRKVA